MNTNTNSIRFACCLILFCICTGLIMPTGIVSAQDQADAGLLRVSGPGSVEVNGNPATDGTVILTDSLIQTKNGSEASVVFSRLGRVEIGCDSTSKISFTGDNVVVSVTNGYASLTTMPGISGALLAPGGDALRTNPTTGSTVRTAAQNPCRKTPVAAKGGLFGLGALGTLLLIGSGAATTALVLGLGGDDEDSVVSRVAP